MCTNNKGTLIVVSGFSGAGKGTIMKGLMAAHGDNYSLSVSATTRAPRVGEEDGIHYHFVTNEKFESMIANDELIEYAGYVNHYYGTPKSYVKEAVASGKCVILEIEMQGGFKVKEKFPDTVMVFVSAPSADILKKRLVGRGTETPEQIKARLKRAYEESLEMDKYDYLVINDELSTCIDCVNQMLMNEHHNKGELNEKHRMSSNIDFVNKMQKELFEFSKGEQ